jgi:hypothetical protein
LTRFTSVDRHGCVAIVLEVYNESKEEV